MFRWTVSLGFCAALTLSGAAAAQLEFPTQCESSPFYLSPAEEAEYYAINETLGFDPLPASCLSARLSQEERDLIQFINVARLERGLYMYECDDRLIDIAKIRSDDNASRCTMSHFDAAGRRYDAIMTDFGYTTNGRRVVGEVITGSSSPRGGVQGWMSSCAGHYPQLTAKDMIAIGTSFGRNPACPYPYVFANFGNVPIVYPDDLEGGGDTGGGDTGGGDTGGGDTGGGDTGGGDTGGGDTGGGDTGGGTGGPGGNTASGQCGVAGGARPTPSALWFTLGLGLALRRRRRG